VDQTPASRYWDQLYEDRSRRQKPDPWLESQLDCVPGVGPGTEALDLGCGTGRESEILAARGCRVTACDFSPQAVRRTQKRVPGAVTILLDITQELPWTDGSFQLVVASLSLHYFDAKTTTRVFKEIRRILSPGGFLVGRVNSTEDVHYGAGRGAEVEPGLFVRDGRQKRFFTEEDVRGLLECWNIQELTAMETVRYLTPKHVISFRAEKPPGPRER
jgi:SAM-dependent methyltransferase